jgi:hypothetical protein
MDNVIKRAYQYVFIVLHASAGCYCALTAPLSRFTESFINEPEKKHTADQTGRPPHVPHTKQDSQLRCSASDSSAVLTDLSRRYVRIIFQKSVLIPFNLIFTSISKQSRLFQYLLNASEQLQLSRPPPRNHVYILLGYLTQIWRFYESVQTVGAERRHKQPALDLASSLRTGKKKTGTKLENET